MTIEERKQLLKDLKTYIMNTDNEINRIDECFFYDDFNLNILTLSIKIRSDK